MRAHGPDVESDVIGGKQRGAAHTTGAEADDRRMSGFESRGLSAHPRGDAAERSPSTASPDAPEALARGAAPSGTYTYTNEMGDPAYVVRERFPGDYVVLSPDSGVAKAARPILYRLPEVRVAAAAGGTIYVVPREEHAEALLALGVVATCCPLALGGWSDVADDAARLFTGVHGVVWVGGDRKDQDRGREIVWSIDRSAASWKVVTSLSAPNPLEHVRRHGRVSELDLLCLASSDGDRSWLKAPSSDRFVLAGGDAILDLSDEVPAIWGSEADVLWAEGEPLMIAGPPGVGKTTLGQQVVLALIGLRSEVLGFPVDGAGRRVLYLAMDRPSQIRRSFKRMVREGDRDVLNDRLVLRTGPPPADLASDPGSIVQLAHDNDCRVVVIDSLKDAAVGLSDDETGAKINRTIQTAIAAGIEVVALHHPRKTQNGSGAKPPKALDDVYGSAWITAGMGSVIFLSGTAGAAIVDLIHLKQPVNEVGPFKVQHDHGLGTSSVHRGFDLVAFLRLHPDGVTVRQVAQAMADSVSPDDSARRSAQRRLDALAKSGAVDKSQGTPGGSGGSTPTTYRLSTPPPVESGSTGHPNGHVGG